MKVIKVNGDLVPFDIEKVKASIRRTGAPKELAEKIASAVYPLVKDGMTTKEVYSIVFNLLQNENACYACRYNLRSAILKLGPAGFTFEKYVAAILRSHGYEAYVPDGEFEGACVMHEIDGIAEKDGRRIMIEAKFRNRYEDRVNLKDTMATWARFLDLVDGAAVNSTPRFDDVWIVTNAKFSDRAKQFGTCKGMNMVGWNFPPERSLASMVDIRHLYPVTVLDRLTQSELEGFTQARMILCKEIIENEPGDLEERIGISSTRAEEIIGMCRAVIEG